MAGPTPRSVRTSDLKSRFVHVAQTSIYQVKIQPPPKVTSFLNGGDRSFNYSSDGEDIELRCSSVSLPGTNFFTQEQKNDYSGVTEKMPYRRTYSDLSFTFFVDRKYDVFEMFDGWIDYIAGYTQNQSEMGNRYLSYRVNYPNDYRSDAVYVTKFEKDVGSENNSSKNDQIAVEYNLIGAYPISINATQIGYERSEVLKYTVNMNYLRYVRRRFKV